MMANAKPLIGVVGPCAAGKSTLVAGLKARGYNARHIAQEHSFVPDMWRQITNPDMLIYLDVSCAQALRRRPQTCTPAEFEAQKARLRHARRHADLYIDTDALTPEAILTRVLGCISSLGPE